MAEGIIRALEAKPGSGTNDAVFHGQLHLGAGGQKDRLTDEALMVGTAPGTYLRGQQGEVPPPQQSCSPPP